MKFTFLQKIVTEPISHAAADQIETTRAIHKMLILSLIKTGYFRESFGFVSMNLVFYVSFTTKLLRRLVTSALNVLT